MPIVDNTYLVSPIWMDSKFAEEIFAEAKASDAGAIMVDVALTKTISHYSAWYQGSQAP